MHRLHVPRMTVRIKFDFNRQELLESCLVQTERLILTFSRLTKRPKANIMGSFRGGSRISGKEVHMYKGVCVCVGGGGEGLALLILSILRKTIEGYLDSVPSLTSNTIKTILIMNSFHSSRYLQSNWMLYFSHASMV